MARNTSEAKAQKKEAEPALVELICPHCGNEDIESMSWEMTKKVNHPIGRDKNRIVVDMHHENDSEVEDWDIYCDGCWSTFYVPEGIEVDW